MTEPLESSPKLVRIIGVAGVASTAFNGIVGAGIFALPGLVAGILGPAAILAYVVCLVLIGLVGLCFAEAGSRVPGSGGLYAYAGAAFGPVAGGVTGALLLFANSIASAAALARFFLDTLAAQFPLFSQPVIALALLLFIYGGLAVVNILGTRDGAWLTIAIGFFKLVPLVVLIVVGVFFIKPTNLAWPSVPPIGDVGKGALVLVLAFIGIESGLNVSGETHNPGRTIPRAILLALSLVALLYVGMQMTAQGVLGADLAHSKAPLVDLAHRLFGPWGGGLMVLATLLSVGGYMIADMMSSPRVAFALAEAGQLPRWVAWVHPRFHTPSVAIGLYATAVVAVSISGSFQQIAILGVAGTLVIYLIVCLGVLRLRAKGLAGDGKPFVAPGGFVVPLAASAIIVWLLSTLTPPELISVLAFTAVAATIYGIKAWRDRRRAG